MKRFLFSAYLGLNRARIADKLRPYQLHIALAFLALGLLLIMGSLACLILKALNDPLTNGWVNFIDMGPMYFPLGAVNFIVGVALWQKHEAELIEEELERQYRKEVGK